MITLEEGKTYKSRDGSQKGPVHCGDPGSMYSWTDGTTWWTPGGHFFDEANVHSYDLIEEWVDPVDEPCPAQIAVEGLLSPAETLQKLADVEDKGFRVYSGDDLIPGMTKWADAAEVLKMPFTQGDAFEGMSPPISAETVAFAQSYEDQRLDAIAATMKPDIKVEIADTAKNIVAGARRAAYGTPEQNFERIARFWQSYFENTGRAEAKVTAADVSPLMRLMKEARLCETPDHKDSFVDLVGYTLTGAEVNGVKPA